ncbi:isocitrate lyase/PEP mutase family protein [Paenibacillus wenxiniae]|uniref:Isocitrate lyase/phosphoenolpyruvate mutase family protein n=1 Tax=Paenibacillus wenxiniae TaxID=1636843 RepID=A0ABW4RFG4_9BACL
MNQQAEQARRLHQLHQQDHPLLLVNVWDAGSAQIIQETGATAIATGSWSVATAHGYADGEQLPFELVLANVQRICQRVDVPVTIDIEGGYGQTAAQVKRHVAQIMQQGAVGINLEDQLPQGNGLYSIQQQQARIRAAREAADEAAIPLFINARTDIFLQAAVETHDLAHIEAALQRAHAYAEAGAHGIFVPGLVDEQLIQLVCQQSQVAVNVMISAASPSIPALTACGVARISYGPQPYIQLMDTLKQSSLRVLAGQSF